MLDAILVTVKGHKGYIHVRPNELSHNMHVWSDERTRTQKVSMDEKGLGRDVPHSVSSQSLLMLISSRRNCPFRNSNGDW